MSSPVTSESISVLREFERMIDTIEWVIFVEPNIDRDILLNLRDEIIKCHKKLINNYGFHVREWATVPETKEVEVEA